MISLIFLVSLLLLLIPTLSFNIFNYNIQIHNHNNNHGNYNQQFKSIKLHNSINDNNNHNSMEISEIEEYAKAIGLRIESYKTGPLLRLELFPLNVTIIPGIPTDNKPVGYLTAFVRPIPSNLLHLETIQVKNRRQNLGFKREGWTMDGPGISFILGSYALVWAYQKGCTRSELLAVKDSDIMHQILIRLYQSFGFRILRDVGDDRRSIGDRLLWGGVGTLMELEITPFLQIWYQQYRYLYRYLYRYYYHHHFHYQDAQA